MSQQESIPLIPLGLSTPSTSAHDSDTGAHSGPTGVSEPSTLAAPTASPAIDPAIEALVETMVQAQLHDSRQYYAMQMDIWRTREAELLESQSRLRHDIETLNARLQGPTLQQREVILTQPQTTGPPLLPDNAPHKKQKRPRSTATVPDVPPTSPARNTRSIARQRTGDSGNHAGPSSFPESMQDIDSTPFPANIHSQTTSNVNQIRTIPNARPTQSSHEILPIPPFEAISPIHPSSVDLPDTIPARVAPPPTIRASTRGQRQNQPVVQGPVAPTNPTPRRRTRHTQPPLVQPSMQSTETPRPVPQLPARPTQRIAAGANQNRPNMTYTNPNPPVPMPNASSQPRQTGQTANAPATRTVVRKAAEIYRALPQEMPGDIQGLKKALNLHIRILWGLHDVKAVPRDPPVQLLNAFLRRFSTEEQLLASQESGPELISPHLVQIGATISSGKGAIARQARLVEENMLQYIQIRLSRLGLDRWWPDLRQTPYSLYNCACRIVAIDTFKQALVSHTYIHLNVKLRYANDMDTLVKLFDHFTFHYMHLRYKKDSRQPGSVEKELTNSPNYQNRVRLAAARLEFLEENAYPPRYRSLINTKATSDDEYDSDQGVWLIKRRPEQSAKAEQFIRILDTKREEYVRQQSSKKWRERRRVVPDEGQAVSSYVVVPDKMPIDYFDPGWFNRQQPKTRNKVAIAQVAFLPNIEDSFGHSPDEALSDKLFTRIYGRQVFESYRMVSDADMAATNALNEAQNELFGSNLGSEEGEGDWIDENEAQSQEESDFSGSMASFLDNSQRTTFRDDSFYNPDHAPSPTPSGSSTFVVE